MIEYIFFIESIALIFSHDYMIKEEYGLSQHARLASQCTKITNKSTNITHTFMQPDSS